MRIPDKAIQQIALEIYPDLQPTIEATRTLTYDQILEAIHARPDLPQIVSERSLGMVMDFICEM